MAMLFRDIFIILLFILDFSSCKKVVKEKHRNKPVEEQTISTSDESSHSDQKHLLTIYHAIGQEPFSPRGVVHLRSLKSSKDVVFHQEPLTAAQVKLLQRAASSGELYSIRASSSLTLGPDQTSEDQPTDQVSNNSTITTITSACALLKSNFNDRIIINGDSKGNIHGLTLLPVLNNADGIDCSSLDEQGDNAMSISTGVSFSSSVSYSTGEPGSSPDTQHFLQKIEEEQAKKETEDNKSFFQKYWLYLLIGFIAFQFLSSAGGAAAGGAGAGGGGSGQ